MKTMLIPVDFTPTSQNAVNFAAHWCLKYDYKRIILLKTFYDSMYENIILSAEYMNVNEEVLNRQREEAMNSLNSLCSDLAKKLPPEIEINTSVSESPMLRSVIELIQNEKAELVVLGSNSLGDNGGGAVSENVISIAKASPVRVLIVPSHSSYQNVTQALLPYNIKMLNDLDRLSNLKTAPQWNEVKLMVLNLNAVAEKRNQLLQKKSLTCCSKILNTNYFIRLTKIL